MNVSSTGDMERDVTLKTKQKRLEWALGSIQQSFVAGIYPPTPFKQRVSQLPFAVAREVADVFVVMKGKVPNSVYEIKSQQDYNSIRPHTTNYWLMF